MHVCMYVCVHVCVCVCACVCMCVCAESRVYMYIALVHVQIEFFILKKLDRYLHLLTTLFIVNDSIYCRGSTCVCARADA